MKTFYCTLFLLTFLVACQDVDTLPNQASAQVDKAAIEKEAAELMDLFYESNKSLDQDDLKRIVSDDGLLFGTDPAEVWDKNQMLEAYENYKQNPAFAEYMATMDFDVLDRNVIVSDDGSQVVVTDHTDVSFSEFDVRITIIMEKENDAWKITYSSTGFLINNGDLATVDSLMMQ